jgi:hypothetical protein
MMGSTCSAGSDLGVALLGSNDLHPTQKEQQVLFLCMGWPCMQSQVLFLCMGWPCMQSRVLESFSYGVVGKFSKPTLVLYRRCDVLWKVSKSYNDRMAYQCKCFSSLQVGMCISPRWVDYNSAISVPYSLRTPHQQKKWLKKSKEN